MGSIPHIILAVLTSLIGIVCLGAGIIGYLLKETPFYERILLLAAALFLIKPGVLTDLIGLLCVGLTIYLQLRKSPRLMTGGAGP